VTTRGPYAKGLAKKQAILDVALGLVAEKGYTNATLREIADAVGLTKHGLLHHFGSKDALFTDLLRHRDAVATARGESAAGAWTGLTAENASRAMAIIIGAMSHNAEVPGLSHLYARVAADAMDADHPSHSYFAGRYDALRGQFASLLRTLQLDGQVRPDVTPEDAATLLIAILDGIQTQFLFDDSLDMPGLVRTYLELLKP
jgi:AcrR family transcriptional regulator